ncbi:MAG: ABC transporter ATP-binding protein [Actinomycetota bacterium]|nr:energy-coupling factor ABC transporter ATP-binding protein [Actinomycetota bacterium]MDA8117043.1 ABC transporter ATP-binding protein [Actinomycetota bacterium]
MTLAIRLEDVSFTYQGAATPAVADISLAIEEGERIGIVGPNGSGKTTLCHLLTGFVPHFFPGQLRGIVRVGDLDTSSVGPAQLALSVGRVFDDPFEQLSGVGMTALEEVAFGLENLALPREEILVRSEAVLRAVRLWESRERSPFELSGGQQQLLAIASILAMRPHILVLDEPTSQLDPIGTDQVFGALHDLRESGITIVVTEHKIDTLASFADRIIVVHDGRCAAMGPPRDVLSSPDIERWQIEPPMWSRIAQRLRSGRDTRVCPLPVTRGELMAELSHAAA